MSHIRRSIRPIKKGILLIGFLFGLWSCQSPDPPRNILLITIDTLRWDAVGAYGAFHSHTPTIDRLARTGNAYITAYSAIPTTFPSHASMLSGVYPVHHGLRANAGYHFKPNPCITISTFLQSNGYETAAFLSLEGLASTSGLSQGFDTVNDTGFKWQRSASETIAQAIPWLTTPRQSPIFVWIHLFDPHAPYTPPVPFDQFGPAPPERFLTNIDRGSIPSIVGDHPSTDLNHYRSMYAGEIASVDMQLQRLFCHPELQNTLHESLIVLTSDHGECFGEQDLFFDHSWRLSESTIRVPLIFHIPGTPAGKLLSGTARLVDIPATLLNVLRIPNNLLFDGATLFDGHGFIEPNASISVSEIGPNEIIPAHRQRTGISRNKKVVLSPVMDHVWWSRSPVESYDLDRDPAEHHPRPLDSEPEFAGILDMAQMFLALDEPSTRPGDISREQTDMLQALGYLQNGLSDIAPPETSSPASSSEPVAQTLPCSAAPILLSPPDGIHSRQLLRFDWEDVPGAAGYRVRLSPSYSAQDHPAEFDTVLSDLDALLPEDKWSRIDPGIYEWSVAAVFPDENTTPFSVPRRFHRAVTPPIDPPIRLPLWIEAEDLPRNTGRVQTNPLASRGETVVAAPGDERNYLIFGPYLSLPTGEYTCRFRIRTHRTDSGQIAWIDIVQNRGDVILHPGVSISGDSSQSADPGFADYHLNFSSDGEDGLEFRVYYSGNGTIEVDGIEIDQARSGGTNHD